MFGDHLNRRTFIDQTVKAGVACSIGLPWFSIDRNRCIDPINDPLLDWSFWEKYRTEIRHPALTLKPQDLDRARANIQNFEWARNYAGNIKRQADSFIGLIHGHGLEKLIETTTPGDPLWTPCPSCREKGFPVHPHGLWEWTITEPDKLVCEVCHETFPHVDYPEDVKLHTTWGIPQIITYYGGEPFIIFGFEKGRPSFTANIRSRKVQWCADACRTIAEAYLLDENPIYAKECKTILSRFAICYPHWLVHEGYGEYADMDPRIASKNILDLPQPEITPPPNQPDGKLWTGYWSAGRASGVGLESDFVRKVVEAYDFTCEAKTVNQNPVYSTEERIKIEKDLLLESTILLVCDKSINNKAVSNRTAVGMVGMCVGHPELMRFGLEGFQKTVNEWFLQDGGTKESSFYGLMTLGGIWDFAQSSRQYTDPIGYTDKSNSRIDGLNLYENPSYMDVWDAFYQGLQGDLTYPPYADSFHDMALDPSYAELMAANYDNHPEFLALLKEYCGKNLEHPSGPVPQRFYEKEMTDLDLISLNLPYDLALPSSPSSFSLYYRNPESSGRSTEPVQFKDWNPSDLRIGHMRTGVYGRESLLLLNASHWRGHNHSDSLNLYYWKNGEAILSDLGYLWDHPEKIMSSRTLAHNTVVINEKDQITRKRGGDMKYFRTSNHVKMMEAESSAYEEASIYRRTTAIIDHGEGRNYVVDFFRVQGGDTQDFVFHLDNTAYKVSDSSVWKVGEDPLYDFEKIKRASQLATWRIQWPVGDKMQVQGWMLSQKEEECFIGDGWGQKDWENSDVGAKATYVVRRCTGEGLKTFVSVYEGSDTGEFFVKNVTFESDQNLLIIDTSEGRDYVVSALQDQEIKLSTDAGTLSYEGHFVAVSIQDGKKNWELVQGV